MSEFADVERFKPSTWCRAGLCRGFEGKDGRGGERHVSGERPN